MKKRFYILGLIALTTVIISSCTKTATDYKRGFKNGYFREGEWIYENVNNGIVGNMIWMTDNNGDSCKMYFDSLRTGFGFYRYANVNFANYQTAQANALRGDSAAAPGVMFCQVNTPPDEEFITVPTYLPIGQNTAGVYVTNDKIHIAMYATVLHRNKGSNLYKGTNIVQIYADIPR